ncbi:MAG TPA: hypothetical protein VM491_19905 [Burkholderiaceae bacterium]|nr:hypothetical protein [Burkholderiaceae bacterium]
MSGSSTESADRGADPRQRELIERFRRNPLGPYDAELTAFLLPLRNLPAPGKHALMRLPGERAWTVVRLGGRDRPVELAGSERWESRADAEWAVFRARWQALHGWDPGTIDG